MKKILKYVLSLSALIIQLAACNSTDMMAPTPNEESNSLNLTLTVPEAYRFGANTRADALHQLRFVAHLYSTTSPEPIERQEVLSVDNSGTTTLSFEIKNNGDYCITVFADYIIKDDAVKDAEGYYADKYYDTSVAGQVTAITGKNDFFNNDNRDCFVGKAVFTKDLNSVTKDITLRRPISKVIISAPSDDVENLIKSLNVTACSYLSTYNFLTDDSDITGKVDTSLLSASITPTSENVTVDNPSKQLFFFYTFAGVITDNTRPALGEISFNLTPKTNVELEDNTRTISSGVVKPAINHVVSVQGGNGWISAKPGANDITVIIEPTPDWKENEKNVSI